VKITISIIGIIMLGAAGVFVYFEDPAIIRIISAAIFIIGAVILYFQLSRQQEEEGGGEETASNADATPEPREEAGEAGQPVQGPAVPTAAHRGKERAEISEELYKTELDIQQFKEPRAEFDYLTNRVLQVMKDVLLANTTALFWVNNDRGQIISGEYSSDSRSFTTSRRFSLGTDLVSKVGTSGKPEIVSEIRSGTEADMLVYYDSEEHIKSFIGVPLFFENETVAVLAADSKAQDAFGIETVATVGRFASLITLLLASYNQKYDLTLDSKLLGVLDSMTKTIGLHADPYGIATAVARAASEALDWDFIAIVLFNRQEEKWKVVKSMTKSPGIGYVAEGVAVDLEGSVFNDMVQRNKGCIIDAPHLPHYRFHDKEAITYNGQIVAIPLATTSRVYGFAIVEYRESHQYGEKDLGTMTRIGGIASLALENEYLGTMSRRHLMIDEATQTDSRAVLVAQVEREIARLHDEGGDVFFFLISCDGSEEISQSHGANALENAMYRIAQVIREGLHTYEVVGRYDATRFGVLMVRTPVDQAFLRAEKIRASVAASIISRLDYSFSISASFGGCPVTSDLNVEQLFRITQQLLDRAISDGGNCVKVA
jgi:diguanylate cyclase (GGDEF)-like protein